MDGYYADRVIERLFKNNKKLGSKDRKFIAESVYDIVRWWRLLWVSLGAKEPSLEKADLWRVVGAWLVINETPLPDWPELSDLNPKRILSNYEAAQLNLREKESVPDWLFELGEKELGGAWPAILTSLNHLAPVCLRANRLKTTREALKDRLAADDIETSFLRGTDDGLLLHERRPVHTLGAFKDGWFEVQDGASQQVVPMLAPKPGERVVDACAGAGGKTMHIASLMGNKGKVIALDVHERKLEELKKRCARGGVDIVEARLIDSGKTIKRLENSFDRVLLDVPCSGLGVLRRNPDAKWKLQPEDIEPLRVIQAEILSNYSSMLKKGGRLVYATCSILPSENQNQVAAFLKAHEGKWRLIEERKFLPGENGYDGFYAAALERLS
jgi:16S rRNA (cytosine967-C5)-methyltransferase